MEGTLIMKNNKIFALYIILVTNIYLCICFAINICMKNYVREIKTILAYGVILYAVFLLSYFWFCSIRRKNILLRRKIEKINAKLNKAIIVLQTYITSSLKTYKHYNRTRRKVNKALSGKNIRETFEPNFEEDRTVLKVISLFNKLSVKEVGSKYIHYKNLFVKQKGLQPLPKANKKTSEERCTILSKDYVALLEGTVKNNLDEVVKINSHIDLENEYLYQKYKMTEKKDIRIKTILSGLLTILSITLFCGNLILGNYMDDQKYKEEMRRKEHSYTLAMQHIEEENYMDAFELLKEITDYKDSYECIIDLRGKLLLNEEVGNYRYGSGPKWSEIVSISAGGYYTVGLRKDGTVVATGNNYAGKCNVSGWSDIVGISAGYEHTVGLKSDGTVVATGSNEYGQCNIEGWKNIISVKAGRDHTVGLKKNGTVVAVGNNKYGQCDVKNWTDIIAITTRGNHTIGLRKDGTVTSCCEMEEWSDIVAISSYNYTIGLKKDGTVISTDKEISKYIEKWSNIIGISLDRHVLGLKKDGTVVATGENSEGQCDVDNWDDIIAVSAGFDHSVGLKKDGTVVVTGNKEYEQGDVEDWSDVVIRSLSDNHVIGLKNDGTVVSKGKNDSGQCNVSDWKDIIAIYAGDEHTIGMKIDGTIVSVGDEDAIEKTISEVIVKKDTQETD